jgi:hypothetical protein
MSYELQKVFVIESYKVIDLHEFAKMCRYIDHTLRDVNNKFRNIREDFNNDDNADDVEREDVIVTVNSNQINQNIDKSIFRSRFETFESSSRAITQSSSENQVNSLDCYNCEKSDHYSRNCRQLKKMNSNSFVRKMNVHERNDDSSSQKNNLESESRKE